MEPYPLQERVFLNILREIGTRHKIQLDFLNEGWLIRLTKDSVQKYIYGYLFELNSAAGAQLCNDKAAASLVLSLNGIPNVKHQLFSHPGFVPYVPASGVWSTIHAFANKHDQQLVCKPKDGTGGRDVFHVSNLQQLEASVHKIFTKHVDLCLSPYYKVSQEYRVIMLDGKPELIYQKIRPELIGDGHSTINDLFIRSLSSFSTSQKKDFLNGLDISFFISEQILNQGEKLVIQWKHNLCMGAKADLEISSDQYSLLVELAYHALKALNMRFASVDIIEVQNKLKVLEVNSGVMMDHFVGQLGEKGYQIAQSIYEKACLMMFDEKQ